MPRKYTRKEGAPLRGQWSEKALAAAIKAVSDQSTTVSGASKMYGIPSRTLRRRMDTKNLKKRGLGRTRKYIFDGIKLG